MKFCANRHPGTTTSYLSATASAGSTSTTATATSTPTPSPTPSPGHSSSKAWIVGAAIGAIAAISLGFLGYWIGHRRSKAVAMSAPTYTPDSKPLAGDLGWYPPQELVGEGRRNIVPGMHQA
jgi:hypothetical protein